MNRRGSAILEATLVFPVLLFAMMALIGIQIFLFKDASSQATLHQTVRTEAGRETHTYEGQPGSTQVVCKEGFEGIIRVMRGENIASFDGSFALIRNVQKTQKARLYLTDERKYARLADFFFSKDSKDDDESENL